MAGLEGSSETWQKNGYWANIGFRTAKGRWANLGGFTEVFQWGQKHPMALLGRDTSTTGDPEKLILQYYGP